MSNPVEYDEVRHAFKGEKIEKEGIVIEVESISTADIDPRDDDSRFIFDVRARRVEDRQSDSTEERDE